MGARFRAGVEALRSEKERKKDRSGRNALCSRGPIAVIVLFLIILIIHGRAMVLHNLLESDLSRKEEQ